MAPRLLATRTLCRIPALVAGAGEQVDPSRFAADIVAENLLKDSTRELKAFRRLCVRRFACEADAQAELRFYRASFDAAAMDAGPVGTNLFNQESHDPTAKSQRPLWQRVLFNATRLGIALEEEGEPDLNLFLADAVTDGSGRADHGRTCARCWSMNVEQADPFCKSCTDTRGTPLPLSRAKR